MSISIYILCIKLSIYIYAPDDIHFLKIIQHLHLLTLSITDTVSNRFFFPQKLVRLFKFRLTAWFSLFDIGNLNYRDCLSAAFMQFISPLTTAAIKANRVQSTFHQERNMGIILYQSQYNSFQV